MYYSLLCALIRHHYCILSFHKFQLTLNILIETIVIENMGSNFNFKHGPNWLSYGTRTSILYYIIYTMYRYMKNMMN